jgi:2-amino-4-hydroxy-6-hydroxymethyldihydropteridine diphosphokinase
MITQVYFGLGANIEPQVSLQAGVAELRAQFGQVHLSPVYIAPAMGMEGPDFLNMVASFACPLSHLELMTWIRTIETKHGRQRSADSSHKPSSHGLDMDLLLFGSMVDEQAKVPRPDILTCAYVLQPLAVLAPHLVHPITGQSMSEISANSRLEQLTPAKLHF